MAMNCQIVYDFLVKNRANFSKLSQTFYSGNVYRREFARVFDLEQSMGKKNSRYWDVKLTHENQEVLLELKKSKMGTYFVDNIRYCEMYLARKDVPCPDLRYPIEAKGQIVTCFIKTDKEQIDKIYIMNTEDLFDVLELNETVARQDLTEI